MLSKGKVRQYGSLFHNTKKEKKEGFAAGGTNWMKDEKGAFITTTPMKSGKTNKFKEKRKRNGEKEEGK